MMGANQAREEKDKYDEDDAGEAKETYICVILKHKRVRHERFLAVAEFLHLA
jgi:hypothetical protein